MASASLLTLLGLLRIFIRRAEHPWRREGQEEQQILRSKGKAQQTATGPWNSKLTRWAVAFYIQLLYTGCRSGRS